MDNGIREIQQKVLQSMADIDGHLFALAGGSALEIFYLNHRFSRDLDFFTRRYDGNEIEEIVGLLKKKLGLLKNCLCISIIIHSTSCF